MRPVKHTSTCRVEKFKKNLSKTTCFLALRANFVWPPAIIYYICFSKCLCISKDSPIHPLINYGMHCMSQSASPVLLHNTVHQVGKVEISRYSTRTQSKTSTLWEKEIDRYTCICILAFYTYGVFTPSLLLASIRPNFLELEHTTVTFLELSFTCSSNKLSGKNEITTQLCGMCWDLS